MPRLLFQIAETAATWLGWQLQLPHADWVPPVGVETGINHASWKVGIKLQAGNTRMPDQRNQISESPE